MVAETGLSAVLGGSDISSSGEATGSNGAAPEFSFTRYPAEAELGAAKLDFSGLHGKLMVLNVQAGLRPPCRAEMPGLPAAWFN